MFVRNVILAAIKHAFLKLTPWHQFKNPVMFTVYVGAILVSFLYVQSLGLWGNIIADANKEFILSIGLWLWATIIFANFAEGIAESRGKAQAQNLKKARHDIIAQKLSKPIKTSSITKVKSSTLKIGDYVLVKAGDFIPSDGEVIDGIAAVNESAITGESAPVIRESGGDRSAVTGGTQVISDWLIIRITGKPGSTFLDNMIALVEGAKRQKSPNELALTIFLATLTIIFLVISASMVAFSFYSVDDSKQGSIIPITTVIALFVCLAPTTIGGLLSAIGIAGMDRMIQKNVIAFSGRAVEAAGDVDVFIVDKTGTITEGDRHAVEFIPLKGIDIKRLSLATQLASIADETPEGRSIIALACHKYGTTLAKEQIANSTYIAFTAESRMSGANYMGMQIRKGAFSSICQHVKDLHGIFPEEAKLYVNQISSKGGTALVVAEGSEVLGVIHLKDQIKKDIILRMQQLRQMGIRTIMVTGDYPLTAASIAGEAGLDDFLAQAKPEDKLTLIRKLQAEGHVVAMTGDGTNDAPALAQADVGLAMNTGTQAAKEAANLIDLNSNPTKLIECVEIGKQLLMTRGALSTFSITNDIAKYFVILPAAFSATYPSLAKFNMLHLSSPDHAILAAVIFNALIIIFLVPLALYGVKYKARTAAQLLQKHVFIYGVGGLLVPFIGIKIIDMLLGYRYA